MKFNRSLTTAALAVVLGTACGAQQISMTNDEVSTTDTERVGDPALAAETAARTNALYDAEFTEAAAEFDIPAPLLKALAYAQSRYEMVVGEEELEGLARSFGVMGLSDTVLAQAAALAGVTVDQAKGDPRSNIRAGAALLAQFATELQIPRADLKAWAPALAKYSLIADGSEAAAFVRDDVFAALKLGVGLDDELVRAQGSLELDGEFGTLQSELTVAPDYGGANWYPARNYGTRSGSPVMVVIHTCEAPYTNCRDYLRNNDRSVSAHYVVGRDEVAQLVRESNRAYHIGADYDCRNNGGTRCDLNGVQSNHITIGIEHGGYASQSTWAPALLDKSARLLCNISKGHKIARDRFHVVGHGKLQPYNRTDPGANWPWADYINRANKFCAPTPPPPTSTDPVNTTIVIDSNNNRNNEAVGYSKVSANWKSSSSTSGYFGTGYFYAETRPVSDGAEFWFFLEEGGTKTVDAWWTAGTNRATAAPFIMFNAAGVKVGDRSVNQRQGGGAWSSLGTYSFTKGWNKVVLSRWTTEGSVVIADAIRIR